MDIFWTVIAHTGSLLLFVNQILLFVNNLMSYRKKGEKNDKEDKD